MRILVVEDEKKTAAFLAKGLRESGFAVDVASDGETGSEQARAKKFDLLIVDIMLPRKDGWEMVAELRRDRIRTPILFLTARDSVRDRVKGLELGADDYLVKRERFDEIIICAQLESFHTVAHTVAGGQKENRRANPIAPKFCDHFPAVLTWQHDIDDQKIEFFCARLLRPGFAIGRNVDRKTGFAQSLGQESSRFLFVLDYENPHNQKKNFEANLNDQEKFEMGNAKGGTT